METCTPRKIEYDRYCKDKRRKLKKEKTCIICGSKYLPLIKKQLTCSDECRRVRKNTKRKEKYEKGYTEVKYTCKECNKTYSPKEKNRNVFCSRECSFTFSNKKSQENNKAKRKENVKQKEEKSCEICGSIFIAVSKRSRLCSRECMLEDTRRKSRKNSVKNKQKKPIICKQCGNVFIPEYGNKKRTHCSRDCETKRIKDMKYNAKMKRKMRMSKQFVQKVYRKEIYERDKWVCQLCGKKVNKELKHTDLMSASLDHIIPLSLGGTHEPKNCQLAHFICNSKKGNGARNEQLRIC